MNTEIKNAIQAADSEAQYDESAKRLLAQKYVLAHILVRTVEEFQGMEIEKVVSLIEGDPYISKVPVASGLTNKDRNVEGKRIVGLNTEAGIAEGKQREIEKVILNMHKKGYSLEQIMDATELEATELETIIEKLK